MTLDSNAVAETRRPSPGLDLERVQETARMLRCLGHPIRLRILDLLAEHGELTVTEIYEALGLEQASCSQHLSLMRDKRVLESRKDGVHVLYQLSDDRAHKVLSCLRRTDGAP